MNLSTDVTELPPPSTDEVAQRQAQLEPQGSKHPPLKIIGLAVAGFIGVVTLGWLGSMNDDDTPVPVSPADIDQTALEIVWGGKSADDRASLCFGYNTTPELMWDSFNEGAEGQMSRATWDRFFDAHC